MIPDVSDIRTGDQGILENDVSESLSDAIKKRIDELSNKLESNEHDAIEEIKRLIDPMKAKLNGNVQKTSGDEEQDSIELAAGNEKKVDDNGKSDVDTSNSGSENGKNENSESESFSATMKQNTQETVENIQIQPIFTELQNSASVVNEAKPSPADLPVQAKEVLSQFIEKASVEIAGGKSEMSVELKPESLGKISLKVVTENGIVMAKFVAENQQVKEVLESNMHLLKDSLENQGMNVQGFSVSVRQDSDRQRMNWERQNSSKGSAVRGISARNSLSAGELTGFNSSERIADHYQWGDSTINLTA
jgi:flagellar hook-length control protein FliK